MADLDLDRRSFRRRLRSPYDREILRLAVPAFGALIAEPLYILAGTGYLRGLRDTRTPLVLAIGTAGLNLVVELVLIYGSTRPAGPATPTRPAAPAGG